MSFFPLIERFIYRETNYSEGIVPSMLELELSGVQVEFTILHLIVICEDLF